MSRTLLPSERRTEVRGTHVGRVLIFCEGQTEKYYFDYFAEIINKSKYTDVAVVSENVGGNANSVRLFADQFMSVEENIQKYSNFKKYLAFDCDAPSNIQEVIANSTDYELLVTNPFFETWLLMHFENVETKLSKANIYRRLEYHLGISKYRKARKGYIRKSVMIGDVVAAIDNAAKLDKKYTSEGKNIYTSIKDMDPYSGVYRLIEHFMQEIS